MKMEKFQLCGIVCQQQHHTKVNIKYHIIGNSKGAHYVKTSVKDIS